MLLKKKRIIYYAHECLTVYSLRGVKFKQKFFLPIYRRKLAVIWPVMLREITTPLLIRQLITFCYDQ